MSQGGARSAGAISQAPPVCVWRSSSSGRGGEVDVAVDDGSVRAEYEGASEELDLARQSPGGQWVEFPSRVRVPRVSRVARIPVDKTLDVYRQSFWRIGICDAVVLPVHIVLSVNPDHVVVGVESMVVLVFYVPRRIAVCCRYRRTVPGVAALVRKRQNRQHDVADFHKPSLT